MSTKTYRLPEVLGGGEYEETEIVNTPGGMVAFTFGRSVVYVSRKLLTVVVPPLPEEPPMYAAVFVEWPEFAPEKAIFRRYHLGWCEPGSDPDHPLHKYRTWAELNEHGTPVRLVPAPVVEPVTLPWKNHGVEVRQTLTDSGPGDHVHVSTKAASYGFAHLKPDVADAMAAALTTAAAKARQTDVS